MALITMFRRSAQVRTISEFSVALEQADGGGGGGGGSTGLVSGLLSSTGAGLTAN